MKHLFSDVSKGYSWYSTHDYYLCESMEEYEKVKSELQSINNDNIYWEYVRFDETISCKPKTECSDGYAVSGGHNLDAKGIVHYQRCYTNGGNYKYYIKPNSITRNDVEKTEGWWC